LLLLFVCLQCVYGTALDDYVNAADPTYHYRLNSTFEGDLYTAYVIVLILKIRLTPRDSDSSVWRHWLTICVPDYVDSRLGKTSFIYIDGGGTHDRPPTSVDLVAEVICLNSGTVSSALTQIPNEPIIFKGDGVRRSEDAMIAYTWSHFFNYTNEPDWLARLPMTKAVVRAMDTIQSFVEDNLPNLPTIDKFVVAGASKRGWTTWTTGAVDKRVVAMIPMVMPILNIVPNMNHHYQAYGGWSFALDDYLKMGLMAYLNRPVFLQMADIVDPWSYRNRLTMPKMIIAAAGDEFFLPDSAQFFINGLPGEKYLNIMANAEHSLATAYPDVASCISGFYYLIITNTRRPSFEYQIIKSNQTASIIVKTHDTPFEVTMWYATTISSTLRDFRLVICPQIPQCIQPVFWWPETLQQQPDGTYVATMNAPDYGWTGFQVEMKWLYGPHTFTATTEINIVPDIMPFPPCGNHCQ